MKFKKILLTSTALTPFLFSACNSNIQYLATANSFIPENDAFIVKKAEMESSINTLPLNNREKNN